MDNKINCAHLRRFVAPVVGAMALIAGSSFSGIAQSDYPSRAISVMVPVAAGGGTDVVGRLVVKNWSEKWGQPAVVENRTGAGGNIGTRQVARSKPDGYTLLIYTPNVPLNAFFYKDLGYDPDRDLEPITQIAAAPYVLVAKPALGARTVADLVKLAKENPGKLSWGSAYIGSVDHLSGEFFKQVANINALHVPYPGSAAAVTDLLGGRLDFGFVTVPTALAHVTSGSLVALGVTSVERSPLLPNVPTIASAGYPAYRIYTWYGIWAPVGTPKPIIDKIQTETKNVLARSDVLDRLNALGFIPVGSTPEEFRAFIRSEVETYSQVVRAIPNLEKR